MLMSGLFVCRPLSAGTFQLFHPNRRETDPPPHPHPPTPTAQQAHTTTSRSSTHTQPQLTYFPFSRVVFRCPVASVEDKPPMAQRGPAGTVGGLSSTYMPPPLPPIRGNATARCTTESIPAGES